MSFENRYSFTERLLHRLAFATPRLQIDYAEADDEAFAKKYGSVRAERPVFITALPRAGTTLLLDLCAARADFATHTYRDMPFLLTPYLWSGFAARFQKHDAPRERAHGDGMMVNADSPEAFEEMLWKAFWPNQYKRDRILPWPETGGDDFIAFFRRHAAKIATLKKVDAAVSPRYISKNNGNIARLGQLARAFPDCAIVVPFRDPLRHAASLYRQHLNFTALHARDKFARDYMAGIGHFDFGANLKPIDFDGWLDACAYTPTQPDFWLAYWLSAYTHILNHYANAVLLIDYDALCEVPEAGLETMAAHIGLARDAFAQDAKRIRPQPPSVALAFDARLSAKAARLHEGLKHAAVSGAATAAGHAA